MISTSYLGWEAYLKPPFDGHHAHVTLKYLGEGHFSVADIISRLKQQQTTLILNPRSIWCGNVWSHNTYVMLLEDVDNSLYVTRKAVEDLRADDFPWKPHITLRREMWTYITSRNKSLQQVVAGFGPLTLFLDRKPVYVFGGTHGR